MLAGRLWGAVIVSTVEPDAVRAGAEQRLADFAELVAVALANAEAREELAASRARIVEAGDAERRRLERNLHDGAQQRLVALALTLRLADEARRRRRAGGTQLLQAANAELAAGARGAARARARHPSRRSSPTAGSCPALEMLAGARAVPVELAAALDDRPPGPVEAAAYYIVAEALTNASKHARASHATVAVQRADGGLVVAVADDGVGGADLAADRACAGCRPRRGARRDARAAQPARRRHDADGAHPVPQVAAGAYG